MRGPVVGRATFVAMESYSYGWTEEERQLMRHWCIYFDTGLDWKTIEIQYTGFMRYIPSAGTIKDAKTLTEVQLKWAVDSAEIAQMRMKDCRQFAQQQMRHPPVGTGGRRQQGRALDFYLEEQMERLVMLHPPVEMHLNRDRRTSQVRRMLHSNQDQHINMYSMHCLDPIFVQTP